MSKNIAPCCDDTSNKFRTHEVARRHDGQLTYYDPGVGTMPEPRRETQNGKRMPMLAGLESARLL